MDETERYEIMEKFQNLMNDDPNFLQHFRDYFDKDNDDEKKLMKFVRDMGKVMIIAGTAPEKIGEMADDDFFESLKNILEIVEKREKFDISEFSLEPKNMYYPNQTNKGIPIDENVFTFKEEKRDAVLISFETVKNSKCLICKKKEPIVLIIRDNTKEKQLEIAALCKDCLKKEIPDYTLENKCLFCKDNFNCSIQNNLFTEKEINEFKEKFF